MTRYQKKSVEKFMAYLNEMGLSVYGPSMTPDGWETGALMDYDADTILARHKYITKGDLHKFEGYE